MLTTGSSGEALPDSELVLEATKDFKLMFDGKERSFKKGEKIKNDGNGICEFALYAREDCVELIAESGRPLGTIKRKEEQIDKKEDDERLEKVEKRLSKSKLSKKTKKK